MSKYFLLTLPAKQYVFAPFSLPSGIAFMRGQLELSNDTQLLHWQFVVYTVRKQRLSFVKRMYASAHVEVSRSSAVDDYVWKEDTRVENTCFEIGVRPMRRNVSTDWEDIWNDAKNGTLLNIPADVRIRCYSTLRRIEKDYMVPQPVEKQVSVYWGATGTGKSRRAWSEAGFTAFPKDPNTKFWDGYNGHEFVVIDEYRGNIAISNLLRWFDRYPVCVEIKGGATVLKATRIWITSNLHPRDWYATLDSATYQALERRLAITHFSDPFGTSEQS